MEKDTILIVDDSKTILSSLKDLLTNAGYNVLTAENGQEGWQAVQTKDIDLVLSDFEMPILNGIELCNLVKQDKHYRQIYFILLTAEKDKASLVRSLTFGADDYIHKSSPKPELLARIKVGIRSCRIFQELKQTQSYLYQQEKMASIGQLAAGVAHEINNPIGFVSSNLNILEKYFHKFMEFSKASNDNLGIEERIKLRQKLKIDYIVDDLRDLLLESKEGLNRVSEIVQNLKSFSRVDEAKCKETDINECFENTIKVVWNELKYKAKITKEYGELPHINCYPQQLNQVFMNFMINAAQAIEDKGEITVKTWHAGQDIFISISDTGQGIPAENINKLFEPFFTTKEVGKGTGLGLSISYEIIKKHNGTIKVESKVGKGTTFTVTLPVTGVS